MKNFLLKFWWLICLVILLGTSIGFAIYFGDRYYKTDRQLEDYKARNVVLNQEKSDLESNLNDMVAAGQYIQTSLELSQKVGILIDGMLTETSDILIDYDDLIKNYCLVYDSERELFDYKRGQISERYVGVKNEYDEVMSLLEEYSN
ncbi:MAG: hypothetical protein PHE49_09500 [bacterium]|nr:hypothetical protein [bacterium]